MFNAGSALHRRRDRHQPLCGVLLGKNANQSFNEQNLTYQVVTYDLGGWFTTNTTDVIPPPAVRYARAVTAVSSPNQNFVGTRLKINGVDPTLGSASRYGQQQGATIMAAVTAIIPVVGGKDVLTHHGGGVSSTGADGRSFFAVEAIDPMLKKALLQLDTTEALAPLKAPFLHVQKIYDKGGWWKGGGFRFTVPRDTSGRIRVSASMILNGAGPEYLYFTKNGIIVPGCSITAWYNAGSPSATCTLISGIMECAPGDVLELRTSTNTSWITYNWAWFQAEEISRDIDYALVYKTSASSGAGDVPFEALAKQTVGGMRRTDISNARLYVPPGYKYGRLSWGLEVSAAGATATTSYHIVQSQQTAAIQYGCAAQNSRGNTGVTRHVSAMSAWMPVVSGDYFTCNYSFNDTTCTFAGSNSSWMCLELRKQ